MSDIYKVIRNEFLTSKTAKDEQKKVRVKKAEFSKSLQDALIALAREGDSECLIHPLSLAEDIAVIKKSDEGDIERIEDRAVIYVPYELVDNVVDVLEKWKFYTAVYAAARNIWLVSWSEEPAEDEPAQPKDDKENGE